MKITVVSKVSAVCAVVLVGACSTISKQQGLSPLPVPVAVKPAAPEPSEDKETRTRIEDAREAHRTLDLYREATRQAPSESAEACTKWQELSQHPRFPLARIAALRAIEICAASITLPAFALDLEKEAWLRETSSRAELARAVRVGDKASELKLSLGLAPFENQQSDQIKMLTRIRELATELKNTAALAQAKSMLEKIAPRFIAQPAPEQFLSVAADFRRSRKFTQARDYYTRVVRAKSSLDTDKLRALDGIRMTHKLEKNTEHFLEATKVYSDFARTKFYKEAAGTQRYQRYGRYLETRLTLARAVWTEGSARQARDILVQVEKDLRGKYPIDESIFIRARIEEEAGRFAETVKILNEIDTKKLADQNLRAKVLWYRAWNLRKVGQLPDAVAAFEDLTKQETNSSLVARNRFWFARTLAQSGNHERAAKEFEELITTDPLGYYGTIGYRELKRELPPLGSGGAEVRGPANESPAFQIASVGDEVPTANAAPAQASNQPLLPKPSIEPEERLRFDWMIAAGESDLARRYLEFLTLDRRRGLAEAQLLDLLQLYARTGEYQTLFSRLAELDSDTRKHIIETRPELLFPQPWPELVSSAGQKYEVKSELVYSIMRQESSFNPQARSHADAFGLMQLIPEMAKEASTAAGVKYEHVEDLYRPETNIPLGTAFLRGLFKRWDGRFITSVASYNASEKAVSGWLRTRDRTDPLQFIEDVPYEETRTYIKTVMRNFVFYSRLNSGGRPIAFPEWCLEGLQGIKL